MNNRLKVGVLISGNGTNLQSLIDAAQQANFPAEIALVISNTPNAFGLTRAAKANIPFEVIDHNIFEHREAFDEALDTALKKAGSKVICLAGFMRILTPYFINQYQGLIINIHPSLLPKFPGLNTHQKAIDNKEKWHGCTVHIVTEDLDGGPSIIQAKIPIKKDDDSFTLSSRVLKREHKIYKKALQLLISGELEYKNKDIWLNQKRIAEPIEMII